MAAASLRIAVTIKRFSESFVFVDLVVDFGGEIQIMDDDLTQRNGYGAAAADITRSCWVRGKVVATTLDDFHGATKHQVTSFGVKALV